MNKKLKPNQLIAEKPWTRRWWQVDLGWYVIQGLKAMSLASDVKPTKDVLKKRAGHATYAQ